MNTRVDPGPLMKYAACPGCGRPMLAHQEECGVCSSTRKEAPRRRPGLSAGLRRGLYVLAPICALWWVVFLTEPLLGIGVIVGTWLGAGAVLLVWGLAR